MNFSGKVALITGSSRGIGLATTKKLASFGCDIVVHYCTREEQAVAAKKEIEEKYAVRVLVCQADLTKETEIEAMVDQVMETFGKIDILVNNAGISMDTLFEDKTKDNFMKVLETNLVGTFLLSRMVGMIMVNQKHGNIVNVSSTNGIDTVYPESIDYDASKAGVISLTKNLCIQFAPYVRVNVVCPGWVVTDMNQDLSKEWIEKEENKILLHRFADPEEVANVISFLASDEASYVNGSIIRVDGGFHV